MPSKKSAAKASKSRKPAAKKSAPARKSAAPGKTRPARKPAKARAAARPKATAKPKAARTGTVAKRKPTAVRSSAKPAAARAKSAPKPKTAKPPKTETKARPAPAATKAPAAKPAKSVKTPAAAAKREAPVPRPSRLIAVHAAHRPEPAYQPADDEEYEGESGHNLLLGPRNVRPYVERKGEQYMSSEQLDHFRMILASWKRDLMMEVDRTMTHMKDEAANPPDPNDRATLESEFALELRTRDRERKLIRKIDEALSRIDDGSYGYCLETGEPIGIKRLEARPVATLCIEAQERRERREKQYGDRDDWYR